MSFVRRFKRRQKRLSGERVTVDLGQTTKRPSFANPNYVPPIHAADKPHPLDAPHVQEALEENHILKEEGMVPDAVDDGGDPLPQHGARPALNQHTVDCVRVRVIKVTVDRLRKDLRKDKTPTKRLGYSTVKHLWFPEPFADNYALRDGNPPSDSDRPPHMRGLDVAVSAWDTALVGRLARKFAAMATLGNIAADPRPSYTLPNGARVRLPQKGIYR